MRVLLAGVSVRALAQSAKREGHEVTCLDHFGDSDLPAGDQNRSIMQNLGETYDARKLIDLAPGLEYDALTYVANLENYPDVVRELAGDHPVIGNTPDTLEEVRHWPALRHACRKESLHLPPTLFYGEEHQAESKYTWLLKPVKSGGGHSIRVWNGQDLDHNRYLQVKVNGAPASAVFVADGFNSQVLGLSEQLISVPGLGAGGFRYCGNIFPLALDREGDRPLLEKVEKMADKLTRRFGLRGVNGLDFIVETPENGIPRPVLMEINPRPTASAELIEESLGGSIFRAHADPESGWNPKRTTPQGFVAKGIVFARTPVSMPDTDGWADKNRKDIPPAGQRIPAGNPICSVFSNGPDRRACLDNLLEAAESVRRDTGDLPEQT